MHSVNQAELQQVAVQSQVSRYYSFVSSTSYPDLVFMNQSELQQVIPQLLAPEADTPEVQREKLSEGIPAQPREQPPSMNRGHLLPVS